MLEVVNPTYSKFENEMYTVTCHYSPHVIISKESLDFFLLIKKIIQLQFVILNFLFLFQVQDRENGCRHCSHTEKFRSENSSLWGFTFGWTFFMSHLTENHFPVPTFPYLKTIWKTNSYENCWTRIPMSFITFSKSLQITDCSIVKTIF